MSDTNFKLLYVDGNIPQIVLPNDMKNTSIPNNSITETNVLKAGTYFENARSSTNTEPLPESFRPRKDGPRGE